MGNNTSAEPIERRRVLAAGLAVGVGGLIGGVGSVGAVATSAPATPGASRTTSLVDSRTFQVGAWSPPPLAETSVRRYREMAEAGITFAFGGQYQTDGHGVYNMPANARALAAASKAGIAFVAIDARVSSEPLYSVTDPRYDNLLNYSPREQAEIVGEYTRFGAFAGFLVADEPGPGYFAIGGQIADVIRRYAPRALPYFNFLPNYPNYEADLGHFVTESHPAQLSFDHYPLLGTGIQNEFIGNWELIRRAALQANLPSWAFIQSVDFGNYRRPGYAELLWQVNVGLAYGCKAIQYFVYWTPVVTGENIGPAFIGPDGEQTEIYRYCKRINNDYVHKIGKQLLPLTSTSVVHTDTESAPCGVQRFEPDELLASVSGGAVILGTFSSSGAADGNPPESAEPGTYYAGSLVPPAASSGRTVGLGTICVDTIVYYLAEAVGDYLTLDFPVADTDTYALSVRPVYSPSYGVVQYFVDGDPIGDPFDGYHESVVLGDPITLGVRTLAAGRHSLKIVVTGKDDASAGSFFGLYSFRLAASGGSVASSTEARSPRRHHLERWLLVANASYAAVTTAVLTLADGVRSVKEFDVPRERYRQLPIGSRRLTVRLEPGAAAFYRMLANRPPGPESSPPSVTHSREGEIG